MCHDQGGPGLPLPGVFERHRYVSQPATNLIKGAAAVGEGGSVVRDGVHRLKKRLERRLQVVDALFEV